MSTPSALPPPPASPPPSSGGGTPPGKLGVRPPTQHRSVKSVNTGIHELDSLNISDKISWVHVNYTKKGEIIGFSMEVKMDFPSGEIKYVTFQKGVPQDVFDQKSKKEKDVILREFNGPGSTPDEGTQKRMLKGFIHQIHYLQDVADQISADSNLGTTHDKDQLFMTLIHPGTPIRFLNSGGGKISLYIHYEGNIPSPLPQNIRYLIAFDAKGNKNKIEELTNNLHHFHTIKLPFTTYALNKHVRNIAFVDNQARILNHPDYLQHLTDMERELESIQSNLEAIKDSSDPIELRTAQNNLEVRIKGSTYFKKAFDSSTSKHKHTPLPQVSGLSDLESISDFKTKLNKYHQMQKTRIAKKYVPIAGKVPTATCVDRIRNTLQSCISKIRKNTTNITNHLEAIKFDKNNLIGVDQTTKNPRKITPEDGARFDADHGSLLENTKHLVHRDRTRHWHVDKMVDHIFKNLKAQPRNHISQLPNVTPGGSMTIATQPGGSMIIEATDATDAAADAAADAADDKIYVNRDNGDKVHVEREKS